MLFKFRVFIYYLTMYYLRFIYDCMVELFVHQLVYDKSLNSQIGLATRLTLQEIHASLRKLNYVIVPIIA